MKNSGEAAAAAQRRFRTGFDRGGRFFEQAKLSFESGGWAMALFMLHQAAELCLRALILARLGREVKEHSLAVLAKYLRRVAPGLVPLLLPAPKKKRSFSISSIPHT